MKKLRFIPLSILLSFVLSISAQEKQHDVIYIKASKFTAPLIQKWIEGYSKENNHVKLALADKETKAEDIDLEFVTTELSNDDLHGNQQVVYVGRYALLPITTPQNALISESGDNRFSKKDIEQLFFEKDLLDEANKKTKEKYNVTVYSGNNKTSVSLLFAEYFGYKTTNLKGKKVSGDELFLLNAIQKDNTGITFNSLNYIYDVKTRHLKENIVLLPLDIKKEYRQALDGADIDQVLSLLENESIDLIPVQNIGFVYNTENSLALNGFLKWVLSEGQQLNHDYGFLNPDKKTLVSQAKKVEDKLLTLTK